MGQYRPSSLIPSTLTSNFTIDATIANIFTCKINGSSPTTKYRLHIMKNDTVSTSVYDTGIVTLSTPLYPTNYDGTENLLQITVPSTSGMVNGIEYKWNITSYWSDTDYFTSYDVVFKAYLTASFSINSITSPITSKSYLFSATYVQAQGVYVERFGWILKNSSTNQEIINTISSNNVYSSNVKLNYDGFINGGTYSVTVGVWTSDGKYLESGPQSFLISYDTYNVTGSIEVSKVDDSGVEVSWQKANYIFGNVLNSNYEFDFGDLINSTYVDLYSGNNVVFNEVSGSSMDFSSDSTHVVSFYVDSSYGDNGNLYVASGSGIEVKIKYISNVLVLSINGVETSLYTLTSGYWYVLAISNTKLNIYEYVGDANGLYPLNTLYPSVTLYPIQQTYTVENVYSLDINIPIGTYSSISIYGKQKTNYIWIVSGNLTAQDITNIYNTTYQPEWDDKTLLLAKFDNTFSAGNIQSSSNIVGWDIYRLDSDSQYLKNIKSLTPTQVSIVDYGVRNNVGVYYYVFPEFETSIGVPNVSQLYTTDWWEWYLIVCSINDDKTYTKNKVFKFDLDVASGQMSNNTTFNVLENFTKYAKIQESKSNYWTGTLSSKVGNEQCVGYSDTISRMDEFKALTNDGYDKFLKDRKGNIWKVKLNNPVSEQMNDVYKEQAVDVSIGWMEIGEASNSSITYL